MQDKKTIGVLVGGLSGQRESSMRAGQAIVAALVERGHDASPVFVDRDVDMVLRQSQVDIAFMTLRGRYGGDGCIQGLLEMLGIPYTGSGVLASGLAMNKAKAKEVLRLHNLPTSPGYVVTADAENSIIENHGSFGFPVVVRPVGAGPGAQAAVAHDELELEAAVEDAFRCDDEVLVERHSEGHSVCVGLLDGTALGALEVAGPGSAFGGRGEPHIRPRISAARLHSILRLATLAYEAIGCEGAGCVELIVSDRSNEVIVDVDTAPALTPSSVFPRIAYGAGLKFADVVEEVLRGARIRAHGHRRNRRSEQLDFEGPERRAGLLSSAHH